MGLATLKPSFLPSCGSGLDVVGKLVGPTAHIRCILEINMQFRKKQKLHIRNKYAVQARIKLHTGNSYAVQKKSNCILEINMQLTFCR